MCETAIKEQSLAGHEGDVLSPDKRTRVNGGRTTPATAVHDVEPTTSIRGAWVHGALIQYNFDFLAANGSEAPSLKHDTRQPTTADGDRANIPEVTLDDSFEQSSPSRRSGRISAKKVVA